MIVCSQKMAQEAKDEAHAILQAGQNQSDKFPQFLAAFLGIIFVLSISKFRE